MRDRPVLGFVAIRLHDLLARPGKSPVSLTRAADRPITMSRSIP